MHRAMAIMVNQPKRHAIVKLPKKRTRMVKAPFINPGYAREKTDEGVYGTAYNLADFAHPKKEILDELNQRLIEIKEKAIEYEREQKELAEMQRRMPEPESYRE